MKIIGLVLIIIGMIGLGISVYKNDRTSFLFLGLVAVGAYILLFGNS